MSYRYTSEIAMRQADIPAFLKGLQGTVLEAPEQERHGEVVVLSWFNLRGWPGHDDHRVEQAFASLFAAEGDYDFVRFGDEPDDVVHAQSGYFVLHPAFVTGEENGWPTYRLTLGANP